MDLVDDFRYQDARVKIGDKFAFPLILDMQPYTELARRKDNPVDMPLSQAPVVTLSSTETNEYVSSFGFIHLKSRSDATEI